MRPPVDCKCYETCRTEEECLRKELEAARRQIKNLENIIHRAMLINLEDAAKKREAT